MKTHKDPVTGDIMTFGEHISWIIQGIIRRWLFLGIITTITIICWATNNDNVLKWWNLAASYIAILIESIVGRAMFGQTRRDAVILREIQNNTKQQSVIHQQTYKLAQKIDMIVEREQKEIEELLERDEE